MSTNDIEEDFFKAVSIEFNNLIEMGYSMEFIRESGDDIFFDHRCRVDFLNMKIRRRIEIGYAQSKEVGSGIISVWFNQKFSLADYLKFHAEPEIKSVLQRNDLNYENKIRCLKDINSYMKKSALHEIVSGKRMEEIPFDWDGYK